jgi:hypothetical protein
MATYLLVPNVFEPIFPFAVPLQFHPINAFGQLLFDFPLLVCGRGQVESMAEHGKLWLLQPALNIPIGGRIQLDDIVSSDRLPTILDALQRTETHQTPRIKIEDLKGMKQDILFTTYLASQTLDQGYEITTSCRPGTSSPDVPGRS